jgi:hypothetical protein
MEERELLPSPVCSGDASSLEGCGASLPPVADPDRRCSWCGNALTGSRSDALTCSKQCRQTRWRFRQRYVAQVLSDSPLRMAYADPPYPGMSRKYYGDQQSYGGEVDHAELLASLVDRYDGWALSTSASTLQYVLSLCPRGVRVCAWVKPIGVSSKTFGLHNTWEPVIVQPGRSLRPGKRDWLAAQPARSGGALIGRKPIAFCAWLFEALGLLPGDELDDLFPGTGIVGRCWSEVCRAAVANDVASARVLCAARAQATIESYGELFD